MGYFSSPGLVWCTPISRNIMTICLMGFQSCRMCLISKSGQDGWKSGMASYQKHQIVIVLWLVDVDWVLGNECRSCWTQQVLWRLMLPSFTPPSNIFEMQTCWITCTFHFSSETTRKHIHPINTHLWKTQIWWTVPNLSQLSRLRLYCVEKIDHFSQTLKETYAF